MPMETHSLSVCLCAIVKDEENYLREWLDYYRSIGVDHFVLYDNGCDIEPAPDIEIIDYRDRTCCQIDAYNDCYARLGKQFDWFFFLDADEFLWTEQPLKVFLSDHKFSNFDGIKVNWMNMTDNGHIRVVNGDYSRNRFTEHSPILFPWNFQIKTLIRGGLDIHYGTSCHHPVDPVRLCDVKGRPALNKNRNATVIWVIAHIKHYRYRTVEEFAMKHKRGYPDMPLEQARKKISINNFFLLNKKTAEKLAVLYDLI